MADELKARSAPPKAQGACRKLILIVDDDPAMLRILECQLTRAGYETVEASNGYEALARLEEQPIPIVIADYNMPGMNGLELCRRLRENPAFSRIYFIVLTAQCETDRAIEGFAAGANDFLSKTLDPQELLGRVHSAWRIVQLERTLSTQNQALESANKELLTLNQKLEVQATTDELTQLPNRRAALMRFEECYAASYRYDLPLCCLTIDIDHFKRFNDTHGHDAGDAVLRDVAWTLRTCARESDFVCRLGGEEFLVICPSTNADAAVGLAERLRKQVAQLRVVHGGVELTTSASVGVAERNEETTSAASLLKDSDTALYEAKHSGRNTVCFFDGNADGSQAKKRAKRIRKTRNCENRILVLVADDSPRARNVFRTILEGAGCRVIEAVDGASALELATRALPDVIILDDVMPMSGVECARRLKNRRLTRGIPILVSSVGTGDSTAADGLATGIDEFISKPLRCHELVTRVTQLAKAHHNCIRLTRVNRRQRRQAWVLRHLLELFRSAASHQRIDAVLEHTIQVAARVTGARQVSILFPDENARTLRIAGSVGLSEDIAEQTRIPVEQETIGQAFRSGRPVVLNRTDLTAEAGEGLTSRPSAAATACMPLIASGTVIGVMLIADRIRARPFTRDEVSYIDLICGAAASAISQIRSHEAQDQISTAIVAAMATLTEFRDNETGGHVERVTALSLILAEELSRQTKFADKIDNDFLEHLRRGVALHDIGKVAIPDRILLKQGKLDPEELQIMRRHAQLGAQTIDLLIARKVGDRSLVMARDIAFAHHEWYDGAGYPRKLKGEAIPLSARITSLVDVYDALTTRRVYKAPQSHQEAVTIIRQGRGTQFDPDIVDAFLTSQDKFAHAAATLADDAWRPPPSSSQTTCEKPLQSRAREEAVWHPIQ